MYEIYNDKFELVDTINEEYFNANSEVQSDQIPWDKTIVITDAPNSIMVENSDFSDYEIVGYYFTKVEGRKFIFYYLVERRSPEFLYLDLVQDVIDNGISREDRTGTGTLSTFGQHMKFDLRSGCIPLLTTKRMSFKAIVKEMLFFMSGKSDSKILEEQGVSIWSGNTSREFLDSRGLTDYPEGDMGPSYSFNFRHYGADYSTCGEDYTGKGIDQVEKAIDLIKNDPTSRRIIISLWDPRQQHKMALPPCMYNYQFYVNDDELSLMVSARSTDIFLGLPFNLAGAAIVLRMFCKLCDKVPGDLIFNTGDAHIYKNHIDQMREQLNRKPLIFPFMTIAGEQNNIDDFKLDDFIIDGYIHRSRIRADMAV